MWIYAGVFTFWYVDYALVPLNLIMTPVIAPVATASRLIFTPVQPTHILLWARLSGTIVLVAQIGESSLSPRCVYVPEPRKAATMLVSRHSLSDRMPGRLFRWRLPIRDQLGSRVSAQAWIAGSDVSPCDLRERYGFTR